MKSLLSLQRLLEQGIMLSRWIAYSSVVLAVGILYPLVKRAGNKDISWDFSRRASTLALRLLGIKVTTVGAEYLSVSSGYVLIANHRSWFDSLALASVLPIRTHFVAKKDYFKQPFIRLWFTLYQHIPVNYASQTPLTPSDMRFLVEKLQQGRVVALYPEGTRSIGADLLPFRRGPWWLANIDNHPVLEAYIQGSEEVWPKGASIFALKPGLIEIRFNPPYCVCPGEDESQLAQSQEKFSTWHRNRKTAHMH